MEVLGQTHIGAATTVLHGQMELFPLLLILQNGLNKITLMNFAILPLVPETTNLFIFEITPEIATVKIAYKSLCRTHGITGTLVHSIGG